MVTKAELELIARGIRARGLHSSWKELLTFSEDVVGNLAGAYQVLLRNSILQDERSSTSRENVQKVVIEKLAKALTLLTSEAQVAKWKSDALAESESMAIQ